MIFIIVSIITIIMLYSIFNGKQNISVPEKQQTIILEFNKRIKNMMSILSISLFIFAIFLIFVITDSMQDILVCGIFFGMFAFLSLLLYLYVRNKKIIYYKDKLYYYNILGKCREYELNNIGNIIEVPNIGMTITFHNQQKLKIDTSMNNYRIFKDILEKKDIPYKDVHGNIAPKGW